MRRDPILNYDDNLEEAKAEAMSLVGKNLPSAIDVFYEDDLDRIENNIKTLNEFSSKCWLISAIALFTLIYDNQAYAKSGLTWNEYLHESRARLGLDPRNISEQLSSARFFIKHHKKLTKAGWTPRNLEILARAELAYELSGDLDLTIEHIVNDTFKDFKAWYQSFKEPLLLETPSQHEISRKVTYNKGVLKINGQSALTVGDGLSEEDKAKLEVYLRKIADSLKAGYEPAIIPVYDQKEANVLVRLRDKNRSGK